MRLLVLALLASAAPAQSVWIVDDTPGSDVDFADVAPAVSAASPGDVVVVRDGTYGAFAIDKSLAVVAKGSGARTGAITVQGVPAGAQVLVRGLRGDSVLVQSVQGNVWLEDLEGPPLFGTLALPIRVQNSADVSITRCFVGRPPAANVAALTLRQSRVHVYDCTIVGSPAGGALGGPPGGAGVLLDGGLLFASGGTISGGGEASPWCNQAGAGLVIVQGPGAQGAFLRDCSVQGGATCGGGSAPAVVGPPELLTVLPGDARDFVAGPLAVGEATGGGSLLGEPGDICILAVSLSQTALFAPSLLAGTQLVASPLLLPAGAIPGSGWTLVSLPVPKLPPGIDGLVLYCQGAFIQGTSLFVGSPSATALIDGAFF